MSLIDRFLVSEDWLNTWTNCSQGGLQKGLSDHCVVILRDKIVDWGPKPFTSSIVGEKLVGMLSS